MQEATFQAVKDGLLHCKKPCFTTQNITYGKTYTNNNIKKRKEQDK